MSPNITFGGNLPRYVLQMVPIVSEIVVVLVNNVEWKD